MLRALESSRYLKIFTHGIYEYLLLQNTTKHSLAVKIAIE